MRKDMDENRATTGKMYLENRLKKKIRIKGKVIDKEGPGDIKYAQFVSLKKRKKEMK